MNNHQKLFYKQSSHIFQKNLSSQINKIFLLSFIIAFSTLLASGVNSEKTDTSNTTADLNYRLAKNLIQEKDKDGNNKLSVVELRSKPAIQKNFKQLDANGDGLLSSLELKSYYANSLAILQKASSINNGKFQNYYSSLSVKSAQNLLKRKDINSDLRLSRMELVSRPSIAKKFNHLDLDGNDYLSEDELKKYYSELYEKANSLSAEAK